jgi:hypothetical protein
MKAVVVLAIAVTCAEALALAGGASRVVFVRNNQIYTASEDGSQLRQLTTDAKTKQYPKWSPDGTRIAYLTEGDMSKDPKSRAKIEVISVSGEHLGTAPVLVTDADGTLVGGMRWIDAIGWYDSQHVFVKGSASPYSGEFRTIDVRSGKMGGYIVGGFAVCASKGLIAYWAPVFPPSKAKRLEINERDAGFEFPDYNVLPTIFVPLAWTPDCEHLAFLDLRPPATLVLVQENKVVRKVNLPSEDFRLDGLTPDKQGLVLAGSKKTLIYSWQKNTLSEAPQILLKEIELRRAERERVVKELGGESPDWTTDSPLRSPNDKSPKL